MFRRARAEDAEILAVLIDLAAEGMASSLWAQQAGPGETALDIGIRRAQRESGGFSYRHATVVERDRRVVGMLLGYPLPDPYETGPLSELPDYLRPLVELEALAPGSWYVNGLAVLPEYRGQGIGHALLAHALELARAGDHDELSIIVSAANSGAIRLYERVGYRVVARRPAQPLKGVRDHEAWVLLTRPTSQ